MAPDGTTPFRTRRISAANRVLALAAAFLAVAAASAGCASYARPVASAAAGRSAGKGEILRVMTSVAEWQLEALSKHRTNDWQWGVFWAGLAAFAPVSGDPGRYYGAIRRNGEANGWNPGPSPFCVDDYAVAQSYFLLYGVDRDRRMISPTLSRFDVMLGMPFDEPLDFSQEKTDREWATCDSLFMGPPALAMASAATGDRRYAGLMDRLWWKTTDYLYDGEERLFYRDSRFFALREANGRKIFWSRGNGWVLAGTARVLQRLPADHPGQHRYIRLFREMAKRIAGLQAGDGYWRAGLLDPESWPAPETSGTGLHVYALAWGVNEGLLDRAAFAPVVRRGWAALARSVRPDGMLGDVQLESDRPGKTTGDRTELFGAGAFLLAGSEVLRMEGP